MGFEVRDRTEIPGLEGTPYRFVREIGRGGMGSVHEVEHRALGKIFVMKVLHESLAHRDDFALRMKREWRTLARLEHPAIVRVTDAGQTAEGLPFFVMERLEGQTLGEALRARGRFGAAEAIRLVSVVLAGLEVAHRAGAIHRDIKPQNLFLTAEGPKILDFGIVKSTRRGGAFVTRSGVAIGTPRYMAPEQAAGLPVDGRADVYACGLVLFEMIAGQDPFAHLKDQAALVNAQVSELPVRLDDLCSAPAPLGDLLARFLAKDPADRPASARLAQLELTALLPLVEGDQSRPSPSAAAASLARVRRDDEPTAGTSGLSSSLPPSASFEFSPPRPSGRPSPELEPAVPGPPEAARGGGEARKSPSVTPPPLAQAGPAAERSAPTTKRSGRPWGVGALVLLVTSALALTALVLRPAWLEGAGVWPEARGGDSAEGQARFDFTETPSGLEASKAPPAAPTLAPPSAEAARGWAAQPTEGTAASQVVPAATATVDTQAAALLPDSLDERPTAPRAPAAPQDRPLTADLRSPAAHAAPTKALPPSSPVRGGPTRRATKSAGAPQAAPPGSPAPPEGPNEAPGGGPEGLPGSGLW